MYISLESVQTVTQTSAFSKDLGAGTDNEADSDVELQLATEFFSRSYLLHILQ